MFGAKLWRSCEKDCSASAEAGICRDECGREDDVAADASDFSPTRTGRIVQGTFWEATTELGSHGVIAT